MKTEPSRTAAKAARSGSEEGSAPALDFDMDHAVPALVARAGMRMGQAFSKQLKAFDLNLTEWRVCASLHHRPHQRLSDLAQNTAAEPSTLSRTVDSLMQRKVLVRDRSGADARALALSLTPEGVALTERIIPLAHLYERVAVAGIPKQHVALLKDMLHRLYENMAMLDGDN
ncbi:winged helix-turn-helix transcriptional regulator [Ramlibacter sp. G-1-2-2]|uniref:Winged helix-turn-helix transcriptional regulator n=1 Tax=Ramlibacter agri TaxID=2728837 RepID=A0A848GYI7_9BURK|nr:MarR family winged helix-turn-helix transcriptional regulator [Ramlibacter agri]NML42352.1 winged helix-turn-helix transcriptional regulator [Ramlibacter agri]